MKTVAEVPLYCHVKVCATHAGGQTGAATVMVAERAADILSGNAVNTNADREVALR